MCDDRRNRPAPAIGVDDVTRDAARAVERARLQQRLASDIEVLESPLDRSIHGGDGKRAREFLAHAARICLEQQADEGGCAYALVARGPAPVPAMAATASELANSSRTRLASASSSRRTRLPALMRSWRESPDPLSSTSSALLSLCDADKRWLVAR